MHNSSTQKSRMDFNADKLTLALNLVPYMVMRSNPRDWKIEDIKAIADRYGISYRQPGISPVTFRTKAGEKVTVPAYKPIKPIYVKLFIAMIDAVESK